MKIEARNVSKSYKQKQALKHLNMTIEGPKIVGFLGHNGAGKTTFLNMLSGLIPATSGELFVNGQPVFNCPTILKDICFIAESGNFQEEMTIEQSLKATSFFYRHWDGQLAKELLKTFALNPKDKVKNLSKGMASALGIITGFASNAPITIFDEPYIGLDVAARNTFYDLLIEQQQDNPRLFILSTHLIDEASDLFEEVIIINEGELLLQRNYDEWHEHVIAVKGAPSVVEHVTASFEIIFKQSFMNEMTAVIYLDGKTIDDLNVKLESVSLQEMLVYLSKQQKEGLYK
ncbi:ABC transporter ATP-binding protein [Solibacillus sp. CAU 1738]|uniref:ABC transporter ATP-binding protein n=1 Tax=Solibacillus sp. CAU 1738 TaxID=3140363 RepID=UPI00325FF0A5